MSTKFGSILTTSDYSIFKKLRGNRDIDETHVTRLMESIRRKDLGVPICCNHQMEILDGQHRLEARKRLQISVPYYVSAEDYGLEGVQMVNARQKIWSVEDYTQSFIALGNKDYQVYDWFRKRYKLPHSESVMLLAGLSRHASKKGKVTQLFNSGTFKVRNLSRAIEIADRIESVAPYFPHYTQRSFVQALVSIMEFQQYNHKRLISRLELQPTALKRCATNAQYVDLLETIYNYRQTPKVSFRYLQENAWLKATDKDRKGEPQEEGADEK